MSTTTWFRCAACLTLVIPHLLSAVELDVGAGYPYSSIAAAVADATADHDIVTVHAGTYFEDEINITRGITIQAAAGEARPQVFSQVYQFAVGWRISADGVVIRGLNLAHLFGPEYGYMVGETDGWKGTPRANWTVENCIIHDCRRGIYSNGTGVTVRDSEFYGTCRPLIHFLNAGSFTVSNNWIHDAVTLSNGTYGVAIEDNSGWAGPSVVYGNYIHGVRSGIGILNGYSPAAGGSILIAHNTIDGLRGAGADPDAYNSQGIALWSVAGETFNAARIEIRDNLLTEMLWYAIYNGEADTGGLIGDLKVRHNLFWNNYSWDPWWPQYRYPNQWFGGLSRGQVGWTARGGNFDMGDCVTKNPQLLRTGATPLQYYATRRYSPARRAAFDGTDIGAYQSGPPPPAVIERAAISADRIKLIFSGISPGATNTVLRGPDLSSSNSWVAVGSFVTNVSSVTWYDNLGDPRVRVFYRLRSVR